METVRRSLHRDSQQVIDEVHGDGYRLASAKLFGVCLRILNDRGEAEEALQEVFVKIWTKADRFAVSDLSPISWLVAIARNHAIDVIRAHDFHAAMTMYAGQFGLNGMGLGDAMAATLRPTHGLAIALGIASVLYPLVEHRVRDSAFATLRAIDVVWPVAAFVIAFGLMASRGAVPFLYFQF